MQLHFLKEINIIILTKLIKQTRPINNNHAYRPNAHLLDIPNALFIFIYYIIIILINSNKIIYNFDHL